MGVEDLQGGRDVFGGAKDIEECAPRSFERGIEDEGQFDFDADIDEAIEVDGGAAVVDGVVEHHTVVGFSDTRSGPHRPGCQADLASDEAPPPRCLLVARDRIHISLVEHDFMLSSGGGCNGVFVKGVRCGWF
ncbi:hypothetical protein [Actinomyces mediterranea]|uniref:hypothetical protein n=1 Tax=Actinomyces mediterranea TaxID=1871028 RepID=UPI0019677A18|nr:hypothetical protein [Actinomyces mediterranea]